MRSRTRLVVLAVAASLSLVAATSAPGAEPAGTMSLADAQALAREVAPKVETLRGARFSRPVTVQLVDDAHARDHFRARLAKFWPADKVANDREVYTQLGLIPAGTDLMKTILDLMEEQAGAYYDPETDAFFVLSDMPRGTAPLFVAHELTHALDDQRFRIDALMEKVKDDDDRGTAFAAVTEGSATIVMALFLGQEIKAGRLNQEVFTELQQSEAGRAKKLLAAPAVMQRSLIGPYILGEAFLLRGDARRLASFQPADIDHAFKAPPVSTEQLIHPEKYWDPAKRDLPRPVRLPDLAPALGPGWSKAASGTMGEMTLAVLTGLGGVDVASLGSIDPKAWTNAAATGWGGDVYHHYVNGARRFTLLATLWDTPADASEFAQALAAREGLRVFRRWDSVLVLAGDCGAEPQAVAEAAFGALATGRVAPGHAVR